MHVYLVQHAHALPEELDPKRHLSERGAADAGRLAAFLASSRIPLAAIWHSGKPRAQQTAEILARHLWPGHRPLQRDGLHGKDDPEPLLEEIQAFASDLMIVGHLPQLSRLASLMLLGRDHPDVVSFQYACCAALDRAAPDDPWRLTWFIVPPLLPD